MMGNQPATVGTEARIMDSPVRVAQTAAGVSVGRAEAGEYNFGG
jgi:hypothetical protein